MEVLARGLEAPNPVIAFISWSPQNKNPTSGITQSVATVANRRVRPCVTALAFFCFVPAKTDAAVSAWRGVAGAIGIGAATEGGGACTGAEIVAGATIGATCGAGAATGIGAVGIIDSTSGIAWLANTGVTSGTSFAVR